MRRLTALAVACALALLPGGSSRAAARYTLTVRLTSYLEWGVTYSGAYTVHGLAGCSWDIPLGATVALPDGETAVCADRGVNDGVERVDLWNGDGGWGCVPCAFGDWVTVEVLQ